ncbi:MAG: hypothetical protein GY861_14635 [bacterium]|nr:hypothetical protein [bacterium]
MIKFIDKLFKKKEPTHTKEVIKSGLFECEFYMMTERERKKRGINVTVFD